MIESFLLVHLLVVVPISNVMIGLMHGFNKLNDQEAVVGMGIALFFPILVVLVLPASAGDILGSSIRKIKNDRS